MVEPGLQKEDDVDIVEWETHILNGTLWGRT